MKTDLERLTDGTVPGPLCELLQAGIHERPSHAARNRTLLAVHASLVGGSVGTLIGSSKASAASAVGTHAAHSAVGAAQLGGSASVGAISAGATTTATAAGASGTGVIGSATIGSAALGSAAAGTGTLSAAQVGATSLALTFGKWAGIGAIGFGVATHLPAGSQSEVSELRNEQPTTSLITSGDALLPRGGMPSGRTGSREAHVDPLLSTSELMFEAAAPDPSVVLVPVGELPSVGAAPGGSLVSRARPASVAPLRPTAGGALDDRSALVEEAALVERARAALQRGAANECTGLLARYEHRFPKQQLLTEVLVLRMDSALATGNTARARDLARRILSLNGSAPHAARARATLQATASQ